MILPAALRYQSAGRRGRGQPQGRRRDRPQGRRSALLERAGRGHRRPPGGDRPAERRRPTSIGEGDSLAHAKHSRDAIIPAMNAVRAAGDRARRPRRRRPLAPADLPGDALRQVIADLTKRSRSSSRGRPARVLPCPPASRLLRGPLRPLRGHPPGPAPRRAGTGSIVRRSLRAQLIFEDPARRSLKTIGVSPIRQPAA